MAGPVVLGVNHAVLWVSDPQASARFYAEALGLDEVHAAADAVFMRSPVSGNDHDLGLLRAERTERARERRVGLYHLAWEVATLADLAAMRDRLAAMGALVGQSDHHVSKSLYGHDPDGNEFEVMWQVPAAQLDDGDGGELDLDAEIAHYGADAPTRTLGFVIGADTDR
jgi:catechol-2,3-dioxygenase